MLGALVIMSGADQLPQDAMLGILLSGIKQLERQPDLLAQFVKAGADHRASRDANRRQPLVMVKFPFEPEASVREALTKLGMTYDEGKRRWIGRASVEAVTAVGAPAGGFVSEAEDG